MENKSSQGERPLISVIIPTHNSASTIGVALDSLRDQTYKNLEVIVVDDNSNDDTGKLVQEYARKWDKLTYYKLPFDDPHRFNKRGRNINAGYMARNYGLDKIHGEWVTFQDADDASMLNRIEVQYDLAKKYNATHLCVDWQQLRPELLGKKLDSEAILRDNPDAIVFPEELAMRARRSKGFISKIFGSWHRFIPFELKRARVFNKLFFGTVESYPGTGNSPLFKHEVTSKVRFRALPERIWPSFMGRGTDRDFNFQVAEAFKNSYVFFIPLYLWRQNAQNSRYSDYSKYVIKG